MDSQRCTGRTTRLILRALLELLELPAGTRRELLFVVSSGMRRQAVFDRAIAVLCAIIPSMARENRSGCYTASYANTAAYRCDKLWVLVRVVLAGDDLRGTSPDVLCIDHHAEELLDTLPATRGWGRLPMTNSRVVVRHPGVTHGPAIDPATTTA